MNAPTKGEDGSFLELRVSVVHGSRRAVLEPRQLLTVTDTVPPVITNFRGVLLPDRRLAIQLLAADQHSTMRSAGGVIVEFSVDSGLTWAMHTAKVVSGDPSHALLCESLLGPFDAGSTILLRIVARDEAGNTSRSLPVDASVFVAAPGSERLLHVPLELSGVEGNALFAIERLLRLSSMSDRDDSVAAALRNGDSRASRSINVGQSALDRRRTLDLQREIREVKRFGIRAGVVRAVPIVREEHLDQRGAVTTLGLRIP